MKKRILSVFVLLAALAALLCGCGRERTAEEAEETAAPAPEETVDPHAGEIEVTNGEGGTIWVKEAELLTEFPLDRTLFSVTDGVVSYAGGGYTLSNGVDVSEYQGAIDWIAVRESGIEFAILRCGWRGYSGGSLNEDTYFRQNVEGAVAAGLHVGAYFFSQATSVIEAAEEAVFTAGILQGCPLDLPVFFDWEFIGTEPARTDGTDAQTVTAAVLEFCRLLESEGWSAGVYSYIPKVYTMYDLNSLQGLDIWMGDPGTWPEFWYDHMIWQYTFSGSVPGIEGNVDRNVMYIADPYYTETEQSETEAVG